MITIELTKEQLNDVVRGLEFMTRESERELSQLHVVGCDSEIVTMFKDDIKDLKELKKYLKSKI